MNDIPDNAFVIPKDHKYMAVWTTEDSLMMRLLHPVNSKDKNVCTFRLDKQTIPDLVDVLIEIQNQDV